MAKNLNINHISTDILIIGSGAAGLQAAITASNTGADVLLVSKSKLASGASAISGGAMLAPVEKQDSKEIYRKDALKSGLGINDPDLVELLTENAIDSLRTLENYGTNFLKDDKNNYLTVHSGGCSVKRAVPTENSYAGGFVKGLIKQVRKHKINIKEKIAVLEILKFNDEAKGVIALDIENKSLLIIYSKAVILAAGGAGHLFNLTTMPEEATGDSYALAYRAGAILKDLEFIQFRVSIIYPELLKGYPTPLDNLPADGGRFYNGNLERYMKFYFPDKLEAVTRDQIAICAQREIIAGKGSPHGGVYGDLSGVAEDFLNSFKKFIEKCKAANLNPATQMYEWAPGCHHFMGGIEINTSCETSVKNLYACGEAMTGIHGANRLSGNALTEALVFGNIAGKTAAKKTKAAPVIDRKMLEGAVNAYIEKINEICSRTKGYDFASVRNSIQMTMSKNLSVIRQEEGLQEAAEKLQLTKEEQLNKMYLKDSEISSLVNIIETENLWQVGKIITLAALERKESRGSHCRLDYPDLDPKFEKSIKFSYQNEGILL